MTQNRPPPAFQEYAASMMAKTDYRIMSLSGRGLLYSMRLECWVNHSLPCEVAKLAKVLGFDPAEVGGVINEVKPFFHFGTDAITCPELDDYRVHLEAIRAKQRAGGVEGNKRKRTKNDQLDHEVDRSVDREVSSKAKHSQNHSKPTQPLKEDSFGDKDPFVVAMEAAEARDPFAGYTNRSDDYRRASDGE